MGFSAFPPRPNETDYLRAVELWIRRAAPRPVYDAVVSATNGAARDLAAAGYRSPLYVSVQVETAWRRLEGGGAFVGIETDLRGFPFVDRARFVLLSYRGGFGESEQVPLDYYARVNSSRLPLLVTESGWTSADAGGVSSSPDRQARWIRRQFELATQAEARHVFQLLFTDLDLVAFGQVGNPQLVPFASQGLVTTELVPKPALAQWDAVFARPRR